MSIDRLIRDLEEECRFDTEALLVREIKRRGLSAGQYHRIMSGDIIWECDELWSQMTREAVLRSEYELAAQLLVDGFWWQNRLEEDRWAIDKWLAFVSAPLLDDDFYEPVHEALYQWEEEQRDEGAGRVPGAATVLEIIREGWKKEDVPETGTWYVRNGDDEVWADTEGMLREAIRLVAIRNEFEGTPEARQEELDELKAEYALAEGLWVQGESDDDEGMWEEGFQAMVDLRFDLEDFLSSIAPSGMVFGPRTVQLWGPAEVGFWWQEDIYA
jgi:hypothetical protein